MSNFFAILGVIVSITAGLLVLSIVDPKQMLVAYVAVVLTQIGTGLIAVSCYTRR